MPAVLVNPEEEGKAKRRIELTPEEWTDDFGDEFYEHILENGFYYLAPDSEWQTTVESIPAPGIEQYIIPSADEMQISLDVLLERNENKQ